MGFGDDYASVLNGMGIPVSADAIPDVDTVRDSLSSARDWFFGLDAAVREGFDEATTQNPVCFVLALPEINAAPDIPGLLEAFDQSAGLSLSQMLDLCQQALDQVGGIA